MAWAAQRDAQGQQRSTTEACKAAPWWACWAELVPSSRNSASESVASAVPIRLGVEHRARSRGRTCSVASSVREAVREEAHEADAKSTESTARLPAAESSCRGWYGGLTQWQTGSGHGRMSPPSPRGTQFYPRVESGMLASQAGVRARVQLEVESYHSGCGTSSSRGLLWQPLLTRTWSRPGTPRPGPRVARATELRLGLGVSCPLHCPSTHSAGT